MPNHSKSGKRGEGIGGDILLKLDGEPITEYIYDDPLKNGRIDLETFGCAEVYYDDILVEEVN